MPLDASLLIDRWDSETDAQDTWGSALAPARFSHPLDRPWLAALVAIREIARRPAATGRPNGPQSRQATCEYTCARIAGAHTAAGRRERSSGRQDDRPKTHPRRKTQPEIP
jgi:hypothetical protein